MTLCQDWCEPADLCCDKTGYSADQLQEAITAASEILSRDTYNLYGICEYTVAPGTPSCEGPLWDSFIGTYAIRIYIPSGHSIQSVEAINAIDSSGNSTELDITDIWFEGDTIYFPTDFSFPDQNPGKIGANSTWNIELTAGNPIPVMGKYAAIALAQELLKNSPCDEDCALPDGLGTVSRDGASYEIISVEKIDDYMIKIPRVALFLNKYGQKRPWRGVLSPTKFRNQLIQ